MGAGDFLFVFKHHFHNDPRVYAAIYKSLGRNISVKHKRNTVDIYGIFSSATVNSLPPEISCAPRMLMLMPGASNGTGTVTGEPGSSINNEWRNAFPVNIYSGKYFRFLLWNPPLRRPTNHRSITNSVPWWYLYPPISQWETFSKSRIKHRQSFRKESALLAKSRVSCSLLFSRATSSIKLHGRDNFRRSLSGKCSWINEYPLSAGKWMEPLGPLLSSVCGWTKSILSPSNWGKAGNSPNSAHYSITNTETEEELEGDIDYLSPFQEYFALWFIIHGW